MGSFNRLISGLRGNLTPNVWMALVSHIYWRLIWIIIVDFELNKRDPYYDWFIILIIIITTLIVSSIDKYENNRGKLIFRNFGKLSRILWPISPLHPPPLAMCIYSCATLTQNSQINNDNNKPAECDKTSIAHFGTVSVVDTVQRFFLSFSAAAAAVATSCNPRFRFRNSRRSFFYII